MWGLGDFLQAVIDTLVLFFNRVDEDFTDLESRLQVVENKLYNVSIDNLGRLSINVPVRVEDNKDVEIRGALIVRDYVDLKDEVDIRGILTVHDDVFIQKKLDVDGPVQISGVIKAHRFDVVS